MKYAFSFLLIATICIGDLALAEQGQELCAQLVNRQLNELLYKNQGTIIPSSIIDDVLLNARAADSYPQISSMKNAFQQITGLTSPYTSTDPQIPQCSDKLEVNETSQDTSDDHTKIAATFPEVANNGQGYRMDMVVYSPKLTRSCPNSLNSSLNKTSDGYPVSVRALYKDGKLVAVKFNSDCYDANAPAPHCNVNTFFYREKPGFAFTQDANGCKLQKDSTDVSSDQIGKQTCEAFYKIIGTDQILAPMPIDMPATQSKCSWADGDTLSSGIGDRPYFHITDEAWKRLSSGNRLERLKSFLTTNVKFPLGPQAPFPNPSKSIKVTGCDQGQSDYADAVTKVDRACHSYRHFMNQQTSGSAKSSRHIGQPSQSAQ